MAAGEDVHCNQAQIRIGVSRAMAFIKHHYRGETGRGIVTELVAHLGYDLSPRKFSGSSHCAKESPIVEAYFAPDVPTVN